MPKVKQTHGKDSIYVSEASSHLKKNPDFRWSLVKDNFITDFQLLFYIPMFKNVFNWQDNYLDNNKKNFEKYDYFLIYGHQNKIRDFINYKVNTKELKIIKEINNFILAGKN